MTDDIMAKIEEIVGNKPDPRVCSPLIALTLVRFLGLEIFSLELRRKWDSTFVNANKI